MPYLFFVLITAVHATPSDLGAGLSALEATLTAPLTVNACARTLALRTRALDGPLSAGAGATETPTGLIERAFALRQRLRTKLGEWTHAPKSCVDQIRRTQGALRAVEDHLALAIHADEVAPTTLQGAGAWLTTANQTGEVRLRSGDVLVSRGNAFVSAAIAKIGEVESDFSHLAQIYIDAPAGTEVRVADAADDPRVHTIEAHIEVGSYTRPFRDYVNDGNARVAQFRPKQSAADAHHAAWSVYDWVLRWQRAHATAYGRAVPTVNDNPPYDFQMKLDDAGEVFCAEVVSIAQATVGRRVPMYPTTLKVNDLTRTMGITARTTFAPSDLEVDPRFEQLAEWRDLDKLGTVLKKDAVLHYVFAEMKAGRMRLTPTPQDYAKAVLAWTLRQNDLGLTTKLPKNMNPSIIALTFVLDRVGQTYQDQLKTVP